MIIKLSMSHLLSAKLLTNIVWKLRRAGELSETVDLGPPSAGVLDNGTTPTRLRSLVPAGISAPALFRARAVPVSFTTGANVLSRTQPSRESMAREPALTVCGSEAPPKWSFREVTVYFALAKLHAGRRTEHRKSSITSHTTDGHALPSKL